MVLGLDLFSEAGFGRADAGQVVLEDGPAVGAPTPWLDFLADPQAVAITRSLARRHHLRIGGPLRLIAGSRPVLFPIVNSFTRGDAVASALK